MQMLFGMRVSILFCSPSENYLERSVGCARLAPIRGLLTSLVAEELSAPVIPRVIRAIRRRISRMAPLYAEGAV